MSAIKCYYAHPMNLYGTELENDDIIALLKMGFEVVNPNKQRHQEACKDTTKWDSPTDYFVAMVAECDVVAYRAFPDGGIGAGVAKEVMVARNDNKPCFELAALEGRRVLPVDSTREHLKRFKDWSRKYDE